MIFFQEMKSMIPEIVLDDPKEDRKTGKRVGQYKVSAKAIYKEDSTYLPLAAVKSVTHDKSSVHVTGCCAGCVFVERLIFRTDFGNFPFIFDSIREVEKVKEICGLEF